MKKVQISGKPATFWVQIKTVIMTFVLTIQIITRFFVVAIPVIITFVVVNPVKIFFCLANASRFSLLSRSKKYSRTLARFRAHGNANEEDNRKISASVKKKLLVTY